MFFKSILTSRNALIVIPINTKQWALPSKLATTLADAYAYEIRCRCLGSSKNRRQEPTQGWLLDNEYDLLLLYVDEMCYINVKFESRAGSNVTKFEGKS
jgi:hypothetical protein